jgi:teichuronic acid biosynthesis glycosyltransferase TuaG
MPYYKKKKYLIKTIKSVLNQTHKNFEIIIIYDENNKDINFIESIKKLDKRISFIYNKKNVGAGYSRNIGIKKARGDLIAFLDCDDLWIRNKLRKQLRFMKQKKADFSYTAYDIINEKSRIIGHRVVKSNLTYQDLINNCDIGLSTVIAKKKLFNNFSKFSNLKTKEDYELWLKLLKKKVVFHGFNMKLAKWRSTKNSLSSNIMQKIIDAFTVYNKYQNFSFLKSCFCVLILSKNYIFKNIYYSR